jgi:uncharacterized protein (TIGR03086 family)
MFDGMSAARPSTGGGTLLEQAIYFALTAVQPITPRLFARRTPCREWDLMMLLLHLGRSLAALDEGMRSGRVALGAEAESTVDRALDPAFDPVSALRVRAVRLLRSCGALYEGAQREGSRHEGARQVAIGQADFSSDVFVGVGAIEVAVHAWDIAQATGARLSIPSALADELLKISHRAVPESGRRPLFADAVEPPPLADSSDRLVAFLGRRPLLPA